MAASSTVMFIFALLAEERSYLSSSLLILLLLLVREVSEKKNSLLQIHFRLASNGFIPKMGFFPELRKQNNDFYEVSRYHNSTKYLLQKIKLYLKRTLQNVVNRVVTDLLQF